MCYAGQPVFGLHDGQECVVCLTNEKSVILMPCRHMCVCEVCFTHLDKCPVCRTTYTSHMAFKGRVGIGGSGEDSEDSEDGGAGSGGPVGGTVAQQADASSPRVMAVDTPGAPSPLLL